eukprot:gene557-779_t
MIPNFRRNAIGVAVLLLAAFAGTSHAQAQDAAPASTQPAQTPRTINMSTIGDDLLREASPTFGAKVEAIVVYNSNPVAVAPDSSKVVQGFAREDLFTVRENTMAITATFNPGSGVLSEFGDALDNSMLISRDAAGRILLNGGAVTVLGGTPTVVNTTQIQSFGLGGNDVITLDETNGALPSAQLFGGVGNDILTGIVTGYQGGD